MIRERVRPSEVNWPVCYQWGEGVGSGERGVGVGVGGGRDRHRSFRVPVI